MVAVSGMIGNLRNMAVDMNSEITAQNKQLDRINVQVRTGLRLHSHRSQYLSTSSSLSRSPDGPLRSSVTSSNLRSPYCRQRSSISVLDVVEPRVAWATRGPRPGSWWLLALMTIHHQLKGSIRRHTWVQAGNVTEQGLATIKQDVTI